MTPDRENLAHLARLDRHLHTLQAVTLREMRNQIYYVVNLCLRYLGADSTDMDQELDTLDSQLDQAITELSKARSLLNQIKEG